MWVLIVMPVLMRKWPWVKMTDVLLCPFELLLMLTTQLGLTFRQSELKPEAGKESQEARAATCTELLKSRGRRETRVGKKRYF